MYKNIWLLSIMLFKLNKILLMFLHTFSTSKAQPRVAGKVSEKMAFSKACVDDILTYDFLQNEFEKLPLN